MTVEVVVAEDRRQRMQPSQMQISCRFRDGIHPAIPIPTASNHHQWSSPSGFLAGSKQATIFGEIGHDMQTAGLSLQVIHPAVAPALSPRNIAADRVSFTCKLITNVASKRELHATFAPRPLDGTAGSISRFVASGRRRILQARCLRPRNRS
ncbi:hypothetical protein PQX77_012050 [Marasmius sp. AFHP31]|nr:hypothetical protein PQX77_012050 [Marasmius sp. AFHP31]